MGKYKEFLDEVLQRFIGLNLAQTALILLISVGILSHLIQTSLNGSSAPMPQAGKCYAGSNSLYSNVSYVVHVDLKDAETGSPVVYYHLYELDAKEGGLHLGWGIKPATTWKKLSDNFVFGVDAFYEETSLEVDCTRFEAVELIHRLEEFSLRLYRDQAQWGM